MISTKIYHVYWTSNLKSNVDLNQSIDDIILMWRLLLLRTQVQNAQVQILTLQCTSCVTDEVTNPLHVSVSESIT